MVDIQYKMEVNRLLMGHPQTACNGAKHIALCHVSSYLRVLRLLTPEQ